MPLSDYERIIAWNCVQNTMYERKIKDILMW